MKLKQFLFITIVITTLSFTSCKSPQKSLQSGNYLVEQLNGENVLNDGFIINFDIDANKVSGQSVCNSFMGNLNTEGGFNISGISSTRKMCEEGQMKLESSFFNSLQNINSYQLNGTKLELKIDNQTVITAEKE